MSWKSFFLGAAVGFAGGYALKEIISANGYVSPEKVLAQVKEQFKQSGPISGSWIHTEVVDPYEKGQIHYKVYKGGISRPGQDADRQYVFIADATNGTILEIQPLTPEPLK